MKYVAYVSGQKSMEALSFVQVRLTSNRSWTARVQARMDQEKKVRKEKAAKSDGVGEGSSSGATGA